MSKGKKPSKDELIAKLEVWYEWYSTEIISGAVKPTKENILVFEQIKSLIESSAQEPNQDLIDKQARELNIQLDFVGKRDIDRFTLLRDFIGNLPSMTQKEPSKELIEKKVYQLLNILFPVHCKKLREMNQWKGTTYYEAIQDFIRNLYQEAPMRKPKVKEEWIREWFESVKQKKGEYVRGNTLDGNFPLEELAKFLTGELRRNEYIS